MVRCGRGANACGETVSAQFAKVYASDGPRLNRQPSLRSSFAQLGIRESVRE